jgi:hypothetical protein
LNSCVIDAVATLQSGRVKATGFVNMIRPDGTQQPSAGSGYSGDGAVNLPWGINVDGNDDVWTPNGWTHGIVYMAGDNTEGHPAGTKTGEVLHLFTSGAFETVIDVSIDAAGNAWSVNNWNDLRIATAMTEDPARSTWGRPESMSSMEWPSRCSRRAWATCEPSSVPADARCVEGHHASQDGAIPATAIAFDVALGSRPERLAASSA